MRAKVAGWLRRLAQWVWPLYREVASGVSGVSAPLAVVDATQAESVVSGAPAPSLPVFRVVRIGGTRKQGLKIGPEGPSEKVLGEYGPTEGAKAAKHFLNEKAYAARVHNAGLVSLQFWMKDGMEWVIRDRYPAGAA